MHLEHFYHTHEQDKYSGTIHMHVEKSLRCRDMRFGKNVPNAPIVPPPQTIPDHIEPLEVRKIKSKTIREISLEGGFYFGNRPLSPQGNKFIIHEKTGQNISWDTNRSEGFIWDQLCNTTYGIQSTE